MRTMKVNYVLVKINQVSVKYWLNVTRAERENQYAMDI